MARVQTPESIARNIDFVLDAITYGNPKDAIFNERLFAENQAHEGIVYKSRQEAREAFARWSREHDAV